MRDPAGRFLRRSGVLMSVRWMSSLDEFAGSVCRNASGAHSACATDSADLTGSFICSRKSDLSTLHSEANLSKRQASAKPTLASRAMRRCLKPNLSNCPKKRTRTHRASQISRLKACNLQIVFCLSQRFDRATFGKLLRQLCSFRYGQPSAGNCRRRKS